MKRLFLAAGLLLASCGKEPAGAGKPAPPPGPYAVLRTSKGVVTVRLFKDKAPRTVENFIGLATGDKSWRHPKTGRAMTGAPYYNGLTFHRVIPGFMVQSGDPLANGAGGPGYAFPDEFHPSLRYNRPGMLGMANYGPNTNGGQFFITVAPTPALDGKHSLFGEVVSGLDVVQAIVSVPRDTAEGSDKPLSPVLLSKVEIREKP